MSENALAQEEIDALLKAAGEDDSSGAAPVGKEELANEAAEDFINSSNETFLALIGTDISIEKAESGAIPLDMLAQDMPESVALAIIDSNKGFTAPFLLLFDEKKMTVVTDLVLMGEGNEKDKFSEDDIDALKEAVNQIMGHLGQSLTGKYGENIAFDQADVKVLSSADALSAIKEKIKEDSLYNVICDLKLADKLDTKFRLLLPLSIEDDLARLNKKIEEAKALESRRAEDMQAAREVGSQTGAEGLDMILDLRVEIVVKLGEAIKPLSEIARLIEGNVLSLDKASNAPVDVIVNKKIIARGELVVIPPYNFAIRVTEVKDRLDRIKNLSFH